MDLRFPYSKGDAAARSHLTQPYLAEDFALFELHREVAQGKSVIEETKRK
jgi:hypothetical protein